MWLVRFAKQAKKDSGKLKAAGLDGKAKELVDVVRRDPFARPPSYEALVGNFSGYYSRRINLKHRFVYEVHPGPIAQGGCEYEGVVKVLSMWSRYEAL